MAQIVKMKRSSVADKVPTAGDLSLGELAMNTEDGKVFMKKEDNSIIEIGGMEVVNVVNPGNPGNPSADNINAKNNQLLVCENSGATLGLDQTAYSIILPGTPNNGDIVRIMDGSGNAQDVPILVRPGTKKIDGVIEDLTCDVSWFDIKLVYNTAEGSWALGGK